MLTLDKNCTSVGSEFFFSEDGSIKNIASGLCLHVANLAEKKEEYFLTLSGNCSSENSRFVFLEPLVEGELICNFNMSFALSSRAFKVSPQDVMH